MGQFKAPQAKTELVASVLAIEGGKPFSVALHMAMAPGWHNYYVNPGEGGQATAIKWRLPDGFTAGPIRWPVPTRIVVGGVAEYVYEREAWLVTDITPPANLKDGAVYRIEADANWLLCREACVPQKSRLTLSVRAAGSAAPNPGFAPALRNLPSPAKGLNVHAFVNHNTVVLTVNGTSASGAKFYPGDAAYFGADNPQVSQSAAGIKLSVPLSRYASGAPTRLTGILVLPSAGAHWIDIQVRQR